MVIPPKKEDLRVVKTKRALLEAISKLMKKKELSQITVNEICVEAGIRRATFYKHFEDKNAFVLYVVEWMRENFDQALWKNGRPNNAKDYYSEYYRLLIDFLCDYSDSAIKLLRSNLRAPLMEHMITQNYQETKRMLTECINSGASTLKVSFDLAANVLTGGITYSIIAWFESGCPVSKERFATDISTLIGCLVD